MSQRSIGVIPARYCSTRLPGKPLALLAGRPMLEHVWLRARDVRGLDELLVATDDVRIAEAARGFGAEVVMTPSELPTGSDRVAWAVRELDVEYVLNIQGDEPLLEPSTAEAVLEALKVPGVEVATAAAPVGEPHESMVCVEVDERSNALSFMRSSATDLQHIGLYGYRADALRRFASRQPLQVEMASKLEQLRFLEYGERMRVVVVPSSTPSVDTPEDLNWVRQILKPAGVNP
ncbi:MAG: 3-deoxy-manno-octulosonate cytidylyltransferase [Myxococcota bacterium]|nr:3-deoxy-manno-octulosonate cytidylyltransferase [Myxococcota bacterium]